MITKKSKEEKVFSILGYILTAIVAVVCVFPFVMVVSGSLTQESAIFESGYRIIPKVFSVEAYKLIFKAPITMIRAYGVTIFITVIGSAIGLFLTAMTGFVLSRKGFRSKNFFTFYFYFTTLFNGGLVPWYILMQNLGMKNNMLALILPLLFNVFYIIIMRSFIQKIPDAISESAKIDGAKDALIFFKIILPLTKPALATIGLFIALRYWNDWYNAMLFMQDDKLFPLQYYLYRLLSSVEFAKRAASMGASNVIVDLPSESFKLAMTVVATGPIILLYPFLQKYFVKGLTVGAIKG